MLKKSDITVGLAGNPNVGKSTLFNSLTGSHQHVANWPGKTVAKKEGFFVFKDSHISVVDLPGSYSLDSYTEEEGVSKDFILQSNPQAIIYIIDAQNLERNLFMCLQLLELNMPVVIALNMVDLAKNEGITIKAKTLSTLLGTPVVIIDAKKKKGFNKLLETVLTLKKPDYKLTYKTKNKDARIRYGFINGLIKDVVSLNNTVRKKTIGDSIDNIVTNKYIGVPIFLIIAWLIFQITFKVSKPLVVLIQYAFNFIGEQLTRLLEAFSAPAWSVSLLVDGVVGGVGGVLVFLPVIGLLFLLLAILEDSGYMSRVAYVMDKFMHRLGLHGKAFLPLLLGFGCNVPGIMATRTLEYKKDRMLTILISPFMSCSARLPVYVLFTGIFFSAYQGWIIFSLYILGIVIAIALGLIFRKVFFKKLSTPFVIELPPYRLPSLKNVWRYTWKKMLAFIKKAGTIVLVFSVIIWFLASMPFGVDYASQDSLAGKIGEVISPVFEPLGFGNWQSSMALMFGMVAKEVVVSTFAAVTNNIDTLFTPLSAYAFMVFTLLYLPCLATLAIVKHETNSWKWAGFMATYTIVIAWIMAFIVYQCGRLIGLE